MEFFLAFIIFSLAITGLSLGVIFGRSAPQSCSGNGNEEECGGCQRKCERKKPVSQIRA